MDPDRHRDTSSPASHNRGFRNRLSQWTDRKLNQVLNPETAQNVSSFLPGHHHAARASTGATNMQHQGADQGRLSGPLPTPDHLRLRFQAPPWPGKPGLNTTAAARPYPPNVNISCVDFLGDVHSATTFVKRDLGFPGQLGGYILLSYGDTMYSDANYSDTWCGMCSDSVALATHDPLVVVDPVLDSTGHPPQFCPLMSSFCENASEWSLGITGVIDTTDVRNTTAAGSQSHTQPQGIIFFLLNNRPGGNNTLVGAGVATVSLDTSTYPPVPHCRRPTRYWWDATCEPWYGDVCALRWGGHVYAYGHAQDNPWVYLTRVRVESATDLDCYEYWNGTGWQADRLQTSAIAAEESVFWQINQGQVVWSNHFGCFIFVYCDNWMSSKVLMQTSQRPEGPWSDPITLYQATPIQQGGSVYAAAPHTYFDPSGKTLVVTFTNNPNVIQAIRVTFG